MSASLPRRSAARAGHPSVSHREAILLLALGNTLWAGTYAAGKIALDRLSFVELNALRFTIATALMLPVLWSGRHLVARELRDPRARAALVRLVLLGFVLNKAFEYAGLAMSTAVDVALLIATESLFTAMLSWIMLGEPATRVRVAALVVGLAGVYLVVERGLTPNLGGAGGAARIIGDSLVVIALLFEAGYTVTGKATLERLPPLLLTSVSVAGSLVVWIPAGAIAVAHSGIPSMTASAWLAVIYMAGFATVAGYWMWFRALARVDASAAAPFLFIQPLLGATLGVILLGEALTWATIAGAALILGSLVIVTAESRGHAPSEPIAEPIP
jgi:drug/metabolite transporter (DMT)-like permease